MTIIIPGIPNIIRKDSVRFTVSELVVFADGTNDGVTGIIDSLE